MLRLNFSLTLIKFMCNFIKKIHLNKHNLQQMAAEQIYRTVYPAVKIQVK